VSLGLDSEGWYTTTVELAEERHEYEFLIDGKNPETDPGTPSLSMRSCEERGLS